MKPRTKVALRRRITEKVTAMQDMCVSTTNDQQLGCEQDGAVTPHSPQGHEQRGNEQL